MSTGRATLILSFVEIIYTYARAPGEAVAAYDSGRRSWGEYLSRFPAEPNEYRMIAGFLVPGSYPGTEVDWDGPPVGRLRLEDETISCRLTYPRNSGRPGDEVIGELLTLALKRIRNYTGRRRIDFDVEWLAGLVASYPDGLGLPQRRPALWRPTDKVPLSRATEDKFWKLIEAARIPDRNKAEPELETFLTAWLDQMVRLRDRELVSVARVMDALRLRADSPEMRAVVDRVLGYHSEDLYDYALLRLILLGETTFSATIQEPALFESLGVLKAEDLIASEDLGFAPSQEWENRHPDESFPFSFSELPSGRSPS